MSIAPKVKKRFNPANGGGTMGVPIPKAADQVENDDTGPIGPRKNPHLKKQYGNKTKLILERLHVEKLHSNSWVDHVKKFSQKNNIPYACALSNPNIKTGYEKGTFSTKSQVYKVAEPKQTLLSAVRLLKENNFTIPCKETKTKKRAASPVKEQSKKSKKADLKNIEDIKKLENRSGRDTLQDRLARMEEEIKSGEYEKRNKHKTITTKALDAANYSVFQTAKEKEAAKRTAHRQKIRNASARDKSK